MRFQQALCVLWKFAYNSLNLKDIFIYIFTLILVTFLFILLRADVIFIHFRVILIFVSFFSFFLSVGNFLSSTSVSCQGNISKNTIYHLTFFFLAFAINTFFFSRVLASDNIPV